MGNTMETLIWNGNRLAVSTRLPPIVAKSINPPTKVAILIENTSGNGKEDIFAEHFLLMDIEIIKSTI